MKLAIILGTRPEIIKMSPIIRECNHRNIDHYILHTGQHYSFEMDRVFFDELNLPAARYNLDVGSGTHGRQTASMLAGIEEILLDDTPDVVLVQGDTNTVLAGARGLLLRNTGKRTYVNKCFSDSRIRKSDYSLSLF